ncbi:MAG: carboxypeptidase-like regulatory domain-containing protein [Winogradskyella sp.]|uniref:carboxypeptidase-like regulatory domain-containing protein n=1 Tax=Winogradskyella sp. TaxID=1883156 RepID=UPI001803DAE4|nr:carboxypeptidase-like regulatory domain-containing protein [Winogradskyella sp.]MBT8246086.1 carboxypeptidase-like regulatory domain-containing protein [Winogradskyella sp.]NNK23010.1 carboxypeptidase-like regulatory domain-containing protein [Winogradskyella sp.]
MTSRITSVLLLLSCLITHAQTLKGKVLDATTKKPLETVSVYFDNTTIGTTTSEMGEFSIDYNDAVQSTLVISFLGYEKVFISDYRNSSDIKVELKASVNQLDEVVIDTDDGMPRAQKLKWFRKEFLGKSEFGKSCKILNENDLRFRYNKQKRTLMAWSKKPVLVKNKSLQYELSFDIVDCEIVIGNWNAESVIYTGTSFYKDLNTRRKKKNFKNRLKAYKGSIQHFMRALYHKQFEEEGYIFGKKGYKVNPYKFFTISEANKNGIKTISLKKRLDIFYKDLSESVIQTTDSIQFSVDKYGNYAPIPVVLFGGFMGSQRIGDALPSDYGLTEN